MAELRPHIETPHNPAEDWHQWVFLNGFRGRDVEVVRDGFGRKNRHAWRQWLVLHCNNIDCPATGLVPISMIHELMQSAEPVPVREVS